MVRWEAAEKKQLKVTMKRKLPIVLFRQLGHCRKRQAASGAEGTDQVLHMRVFGSQYSRLFGGL